MIEVHLLESPYTEFEKPRQPINRASLLRVGTLIALRPDADTSPEELVDEIRAMYAERPGATIILWVDRVETREEALVLAHHAGDEGVRGFVATAEPSASSLSKQLTDPLHLADDVLRMLRRLGFEIDAAAEDFIRFAHRHWRNCRSLKLLITRASNDRARSWRSAVAKGGLGAMGEAYALFRLLRIAIELQRSKDSAEQMAFRCGFYDLPAMRRRLVNVLGSNPQLIRRGLGREWLLLKALRLARLMNPQKHARGTHD